MTTLLIVLLCIIAFMLGYTTSRIAITISDSMKKAALLKMLKEFEEFVDKQSKKDKE